MRTTTLFPLVAVAIALVALHAFGQEVVPAPAPANAATVGPHVSAKASDQSASTPAANAATAQDANRWRYRWSNGRWWYWTPQSRWMWYSEDGRWVDYDPNDSPPPVAEVDRPAAYGYFYRAAYRYCGYPGYYPRDGYWDGYFFPGVAVGVRPYGNVDVGVGRRIGVGVWGPHGGVRVGRIYVGW